VYEGRGNYIRKQMKLIVYIVLILCNVNLSNPGHMTVKMHVLMKKKAKTKWIYSPANYYG